MEGMTLVDAFVFGVMSTIFVGVIFKFWIDELSQKRIAVLFTGRTPIMTFKRKELVYDHDGPHIPELQNVEKTIRIPNALIVGGFIACYIASIFLLP